MVFSLKDQTFRLVVYVCVFASAIIALRFCVLSNDTGNHSLVYKAFACHGLITR